MDNAIKFMTGAPVWTGWHVDDRKELSNDLSNLSGRLRCLGALFGHIYAAPTSLWVATVATCALPILDLIGWTVSIRHMLEEGMAIHLPTPLLKTNAIIIAAVVIVPLSHIGAAFRALVGIIIPSAYLSGWEVKYSTKEALLEAVCKGNGGSELKYASDELKEDQSAVLEIIKHDPKAMEHAAPALKKSREFILAALKLDKSKDYLKEMVSYADSSLQVNEEFILKLITEVQGIGLFHLPDHFMEHRDAVLALVKKNGSDLVHASPALKQDREVVKAAVSQDGGSLCYADSKLKKDPAFVQELLEAPGINLKLYDIDSSLRANKEIVLKCVKKNSWDVIYADPLLKKDPEVAAAAIKQSTFHFHHVDSSLKRDGDFILKLFKDGVKLFREDLDPTLQDDPEFIFELVKWKPDGNSLEYASDRLRKEAQFIRRLIETCGLTTAAAILSGAHKSLREDPKFIITLFEGNLLGDDIDLQLFNKNEELLLAAVKQHPSYLNKAHNDLRKDRAFIAKAIQQNYMALDYATYAKGDGFVRIVSRDHQRDAELLAQAVEGFMLDEQERGIIPEYSKELSMQMKEGMELPKPISKAMVLCPKLNPTSVKLLKTHALEIYNKLVVPLKIMKPTFIFEETQNWFYIKRI